MKVKQALEKALHELQLEYLDLYLVSDITTHSECSSLASSCNVDNFINLLFRAALWCCCYLDGMLIIYLYNKKHGVCLCFWAVRTYLQTFLRMPPFKPTYIDLHFTLVDSMSSMLLMLRGLMRFQLKRSELLRIWELESLNGEGAAERVEEFSVKSLNCEGAAQRQEEFNVESLNHEGAQSGKNSKLNPSIVMGHEGGRIQNCCLVGQRGVISKNCVVFSHICSFKAAH